MGVAVHSMGMCISFIRLLAIYAHIKMFITHEEFVDQRSGTVLFQMGVKMDALQVLPLCLPKTHVDRPETTLHLIEAYFD